MKTAMQELIEKLKAKGGGMEIYLNANTEIINKAFEKEKEQIIDFAYGCTQHISREEIEEYYNKEFKNQ